MDSAEKTMGLRYAGMCALCGTALPKGELAVYNQVTKTVRCLTCPSVTPPRPADTPAGASPPLEEPDAPVPRPSPPGLVVPVEIDTGPPGRVITATRDGWCATCSAALPTGTKVRWDRRARVIHCVTCGSAEPIDAASPPVTVAPSVDTPDASTGTEANADPGAPELLRLSGVAGESARREFERRHTKRQAQLEQRWGRFAGIAKALSSDPQSTLAWARGAEGERRFGEAFTKTMQGRAIALHDRRVPRTRGNVDHLIIAPSGVWVVDAKRYTGKVEQRDVGGFFETDLRLYVNNRDQSKLAAAMAWQLDAVRTALDDPDVAVHAGLCFIDADWAWLAKPFTFNGVWVSWPSKLFELMLNPATLSDEQMGVVADRLATRLPPVVKSDPGP